MPNPDVAIPIVFPDYRITVIDRPASTVKVPDLLPRVDILPDRITVPAAKYQMSHLGHAGILLIHGQTGLTRYFEYGRYDPQEKGWVKKRSIPDVTIGRNGRPTRKSLAKTLREISMSAGQGSRIAGAYIELLPGAFQKMQAYAEAREAKNHDPKRAPYELLSNSCLHFMKSTAEAGGARMPPVMAPHPAGYIFQVQIGEFELDFAPAGTTTVEISLE